MSQEEFKIAAKNGDVETVKAFIIGLDFSDKRLYQALNISGRHGHISVVKVLIDKGININFKGKYGWTALAYL
ncbi:MAG TPA: ankyrin repeat domain-containing protein [Candidatus Wallbacteria bacterium]|nr:ankyrin repeat domain-containing protein [Candidatus Wallbacteria bacterium]